MQEPLGEPLTCSDPEKLLRGLLPRRHPEGPSGVFLEVLSLSQLPRCFSFGGQSLVLVDCIFQQLPEERSVGQKCLEFLCQSLLSIAMLNENLVKITLEE